MSQLTSYNNPYTRSDYDAYGFYSVDEDSLEYLSDSDLFSPPSIQSSVQYQAVQVRGSLEENPDWRILAVDNLLRRCNPKMPQSCRVEYNGKWGTVEFQNPSVSIYRPRFHTEYRPSPVAPKRELAQRMVPSISIPQQKPAELQETGMGATGVEETKTPGDLIPPPVQITTPEKESWGFTQFFLWLFSCFFNTSKEADGLT